MAARWSARFEVISKNPLFIFDGAHNPEGITAATESILHYFGNEKVVVLSGVLADKDYNFIAKKLARVASHAVTITPDNPRALRGEEYARLLSALGVAAESAESILEAVARAIALAERESTAVVCLGSLYTYAEVSSAIKNLNK